MNEASLQSRRQIVKTFAVLSASSILLGKQWMARVLAQMGPLPTQTGGRFRLKVSDFPALAQTGGSVRIGTSGLMNVSTVCQKPIGLFSPLLINRAAGNQFYALNAACTHEGCTLPIYSSSLGYSKCTHQGSRFTIDGTCIRGPNGGALVFPLQAYTTQYDGVDTLTVDIPEMSFDLTTAGVQTGGLDRLSLTFLAFEAIDYEVQGRATLAANWTVVPFSLTPTGAADQTVLAGNSDYNTVYVDRSAGLSFFSVVMKTFPV